MSIRWRIRKEIGKTGEYVSPIGLGTWGIRDYRSALKTFIYSYENGIDNVDTAEIYDSGRAEEFIGRFLKEVGRENIFVTTKLTPYNLLDRDRAVKAARESLRRMGIKTVDLILLHWSEDTLHIPRQVRNLEYLIRLGLTRYIGVSNLNLDQLKLAIESLSRYDIVVDQVKYSVLDKRVEKEGLLNYCIKNGITIQAYTPLEGGRIIHMRELINIAEKYKKTPIEIALNYLISHERVIAIPKTENMEHAKEIINSMGFRLSQRDILELSRLKDYI